MPSLKRRLLNVANLILRPTGLELRRRTWLELTMNAALQRTAARDIPLVCSAGGVTWLTMSPITGYRIRQGPHAL